MAKVRIKGKVPDEDAKPVSRWSAPAHAGRQKTPLYTQEGGLRYVGCVVNPKDLKPYFVVCRPKYAFRTFVVVPSMQPRPVLVGSGYFEDDRRSDYAAPALASGYPRVHTPDGVADKGSGLGTVLYAGCALTAAFMHENPGTQRSDVPGDKDGISSGDGASPAARAWWKRAAEAGLASKEWFDNPVQSEPETGTRDVTIPYSGGGGSSRILPERIWRDLLDVEGEILTVHVWNGRQPWTAFDYTWRFESESGEVQTGEGSGQVRLELDSLPRWQDVDSQLREAAEEHIANDDDAPEGAELVDVWADAIELTLWVEWQPENGGESIEVFTLPTENVHSQGLCLDVWDGDVARRKRTILGLDLSDVTDPAAVQYFYGLAEEAGASFAELQRFRNRVEAFRSYMTTEELPTYAEAREALERTQPDSDDEDRARRLRFNPHTDFKSVARKLFPKLQNIG